MKILTIVGARPQFIKAAVISRVIKNYSDIEERLLHTGQHYDENMSASFFNQLEIPLPYLNLNINQCLPGEMVGRILQGIEEQIIAEKPDALLVYGDTNSTLAGALAASKQMVPLIHVEAGLRSYNMNMPEEINRVITDRISTLLFCPTQNAMENLSKEGFDYLKMKYFLSGDVMLDATLYYKQKALLSTPEFSKKLPAEFALCTFHRSENIDNDERLTELVETLNLVSKNIAVVCPMHPHTEQRIRQLKLMTDFTILAPQSYFNMIHLLDCCLLVLTDSGGLQKEAYFHKKRCICLRNETEWTELSKDNYVIVTGIDGEKVKSAVTECISNPLNFESSYYGNGTAGEFIVNQIAKM